MTRTGRDGPFCEVVLDLRGVPWAGDEDQVRRRLLAHPGVLGVDVDVVRRRALVRHASGTSLPALFNWVLSCREPAPPATSHRSR